MPPILNDERQPRLTVLEDFDDFRQGASFTQTDFLMSAWWCVWPYGLRLRDDDGNVYEVQGWLRKFTWRQRLVGDGVMIEPVNCTGLGRRVER